MEVIVKYIRNIALQGLSVLMMGSSLCVSQDDVQAFMEAHKQKLTQKMIAPINDFFDADATRYVRYENDDSFFYAFQKQFNKYRSYFPQGDPQVDQTLRNIFSMRMREKLLRIMSLNNSLNKQIAQKEKGFVQNIETDELCAGCLLGAISGAFWGLQNVMQLQGDNAHCFQAASLLSGLFSARSFAKGLMGYDDLELEIKHLTRIVHVCQQDVLQLDRAYAYAFPGEPILSEQVQALFQKMQETEALCVSVSE